MIKLSFKLLQIALSIALIFSANSALAQEEPKLEFGVGVVGQYSADYRGSKHYSLEALPLPYLLYRGKIFKVDRNGVRGEFVQNRRYELNISVDGSLNGDSDDNKLREGMPELDSAFEVGPSFNINISGEDFKEGWSLRLPVRAVVAFNSSGLDYVGYLFNPRLTWRKPNAFNDWRLTFNLGALWANQSYHAYYYDVAAQYALPTRPEYYANSGYSGSFARLGLYRHYQTWRFGLSLRYDNLSDAAFEDSPLVETDNYASFGFAVMKQLWFK